MERFSASCLSCVWGKDRSTGRGIYETSFFLGYINGNSESGTQPPEVDEMLRLLIGPLPAGLVFASICLLYLYPLTTEVVNNNVETLKQQRKAQLTDLTSFPTVQTTERISFDNEKTSLLHRERLIKEHSQIRCEEMISPSDLDSL